MPRDARFPIGRAAVILVLACAWHISVIVLAIVLIGATVDPVPGGPEYGSSHVGLDCVQDIDLAPTMESKLEVLNCLVIDAPNGRFETNADSLKQCIDESRTASQDGSPCSWLGYGNWKCSVLPLRVPLPACLKHDLAYASLQRFDGDGGIHSLDEAWNPRNKYLADVAFKDDLDRDTSALDPILGPLRQHVGIPSMHWVASRVNNKTWPVTHHDIQDIRDRTYFRRCAVPKVENVQVTRRGDVFEATWDYSPGCLKDITVDYYRLCWKVSLPIYLYAINPRALARFCGYSEGDASAAVFTVPSAIRGWSSVTLESVEIRPNDIEYGGPLGSANLLGGKVLDPILNGAYYPKQRLSR